MVLMFAVALFKAWPAVMERINERYRDRIAEEAGDWHRLRVEIERLDARCDHLQSEVDDCRKREGEWMHRAIAAEAYQLGEGEALQAAQRIISRERTADKKADGE
jgi:hypothetical protein